MDKRFFPDGTAISLRLESLIKITDKRPLSEKMSSRMV